jgi:hypothetical protein
MALDGWLNPLRKKPAFTALIRTVEAQHRLARADFARLNGPALLALPAGVDS